MNPRFTKTFNIEDMETYFKNYVPCHYHKKEPITNFCADMTCAKFLCPQCVEEHSKIYNTHQIQSIKTCILRTKGRIQETVLFLNNLIIKNSFLSPQNREESSKKLINQLQEFKRNLLQEIQQYFNEKEIQIRKETSKFSQTQKTLDSLKKELQQAAKQLNVLKRGLFEPNKTVTIIQKTNKLDYKAMMEHFLRKIKRIEQEQKLNSKLEIMMDSKRRQQFRHSLNNLIGLTGIQSGEQFNDNLLNPPIIKTQPKDSALKNSHLAQNNNYLSQSKKEFITNQPLSVDRQIEKRSILIQYPDYFKTGEPFLHFFQLSKSNLHIIKIAELAIDPKWEIISLKINFSLPTFHRTVATQEGVIYLIGGNDDIRKQKYQIIWEYSPEDRALQQVAEMKFQRSSHSVVCFNGLIYIVGGMGSTDILKELEVFNPKSRTIQQKKSCKYATVNSCFAIIGKQNLIKLGGIFSNGSSNDHIELYNIVSDTWTQIDPVIEGVKGDFSLLSCSGWSCLTENRVFIFGGYNQEADNESSSNSFIIQYDLNEKDYIIKQINKQKLPIEEGFWNPQSVVHKNRVYALQNVNDGDEDQCVQDRRNVLMFDGKFWQLFSDW